MRFFKKRIGFLLVLSLFCCTEDEKDIEPLNENGKGLVNSDYTHVDGELTVLVDNSLSSYFIYKGEPKGFEYELLKIFAEEHGLKLKLKIIENTDGILDSLQKGKGDVVAANLAISEKRKEKVNFTEPLFQTKQILVQRLPTNRKNLTADEINQSLVNDPIQLEGKKVMVRKNSSYYERLLNFKSETGTDFSIQLADDYLVTEYLIEMVANGKIDYTVCDENKANLICPSFNNIDCNTPISFSQNIGWAVRKESTRLLDSLNLWIDKEKGSKQYNLIFSDYFESKSKTRKVVKNDFEDIVSGQISEYDELIKKYALKINWDWKLLGALIYQESKFDPSTKSWAGAIGLMQLMPNTAESHGVNVNDLTKPEPNLMAGTSQLVWLQRQWKSVLKDSSEVIKFTLASYNVGFGHVSDARRMAKKNGMNPDKWDDSVEQMLLLKTKPKYFNQPEVKYGYCRGTEPVNYVKDILENYNLYKDFNKSDLINSLEKIQ